MRQEMRRKKQILPEEETDAIFERGSNGVLALEGDDGYPYGVPLSYVLQGSKIYFHSARTGHKIDAIGRNPKASFCVVDKDQVAPEEYTTYFRSAIAFGTVRIVEDEEEKRAALVALARKYAPALKEEDHQAEIEKGFQAVSIIEFSIQHKTGKEAIELTRQRKQP